MSRNKFAVVYKNKVQYHINERLVKQNNISDDGLSLIKKLHRKKLKIFDKMEATDNKDQLKAMAKEVEEIEYDLQDAWGFPRDSNFHYWFEVPKCRCGKLDAKDTYGTKYRYIMEDCPIHGSI